MYDFHFLSLLYIMAPEECCVITVSLTMCAVKFTIQLDGTSIAATSR